MASAFLRYGSSVAIDIGDLRCLAAAANATNFAQAAASLGLNSSTISRRIARLEDRLGVTLFERGRFGVRLTPAGIAVMVHVGRTLDDLEAVASVGQRNGEGAAGRVRLGVRMPPIGEPLKTLLAAWHEDCPDVTLQVSELNDEELRAGLADRRLDAAFVTAHTRWLGATTIPIYRERLLAALPVNHCLSLKEVLSWEALRGEIVLTQEWDGSHSAREFYASMMGSGVRFSPHAASKQSVLALVGAGFGVTLVTESQSSVSIPGVAFKVIEEPNAWVEIELAWSLESKSAVLGRFIAFVRDRAVSVAV